MYFKSKSGGRISCGRVRAHFPKAVKHEKYVVKYNPDQKDTIETTIQGRKLTKEQVLEIVKDCNICGCGGSRYPMYKKLEGIMNSNVTDKTLIINAVECDIGLIQDEFIMATFFAEVEIAAKVLKDTFGFSRVVLGTTQKYDYDSSVIEIKRVSYGYPAGFEKVLINSLLGIVIKENELPVDHGILVQNVQTMLMLFNALKRNEKCTGKYITVANLVNHTGITAYVPFSSDIESVAKEYLGDINKDRNKDNEKPLVLLAGGGAMSGHIVSPGEVTDKTTSLIAIGYEPYNQRTIECMYCHACSRACPMNLNVCKLTDLIMSEHFEEAKAFSPQKCIGCNSCTYVCFLNRDNSKVIAEFNESQKA